MRVFRGLQVATIGAMFYLLVLSFPLPVRACHWLPAEKLRVADRFDVVLRDRGRPISGMAVTVERFRKRSETWEQVAQAVTDETGVARFAGIRPGPYWVMTNTLVDNAAQEIEVTANARRPVEPAIDLSWPSKKVIVTSSLKGRLSSFPSDEGPPKPLGGVGLTLLESHSGQIVGAGVTNSDGVFEFTDVSPGLYFLSVTCDDNKQRDPRLLGKGLQGNIPLEYNPTNARVLTTLQLQLTIPMCGGLRYSAAD